VLISSGLTFHVENSSGQPLTMYVLDEPAPPSFRPNTSMLVRDENQLPSSSGMWAHIVKTLFVTEDGLSTLQAVLTVTLDPLTIGQPHPVPGEDTDEIEEVGTADNQNPHTNINSSQDSQARFLYFARHRSHELRK
jgi:hypothetical protein